MGVKHDLTGNGTFRSDSFFLFLFFNLMTLFTAIDDFSGPAESTTFPLGSMIPIMASVAQETHQPMLLLLEECVAAYTPALQPESSIYPIITNKGYSCCTGNENT